MFIERKIQIEKLSHIAFILRDVKLDQNPQNYSRVVHRLCSRLLQILDHESTDCGIDEEGRMIFRPVRRKWLIEDHRHLRVITACLLVLRPGRMFWLSKIFHFQSISFHKNPHTELIHTMADLLFQCSLLSFIFFTGCYHLSALWNFHLRPAECELKFSSRGFL